MVAPLHSRRQPHRSRHDAYHGRLPDAVATPGFFAQSTAKNAFYNRLSKSLQFYHFGSEEGTVYTCLSTDIVCHELGHAALDGVRPFYSESSLVQTAAFHEAIGSITASLMSLRNNAFRQWLRRLGAICREHRGKSRCGKSWLTYGRQSNMMTRTTQKA
jgi:hypothetical protein